MFNFLFSYDNVASFRSKNSKLWHENKFVPKMNTFIFLIDKKNYSDQSNFLRRGSKIQHLTYIFRFWATLSQLNRRRKMTHTNIIAKNTCYEIRCFVKNINIITNNGVLYQLKIPKYCCTICSWNFKKMFYKFWIV